MGTNRFRLRLVAAAIFAFAGASSALADPPTIAPDPPARVGRLSYMEGTVSFHTADQTTWAPATLNYPVTSGLSLWTEPNSRSEVEVGDAEVRMDQSTALDINHLDDTQTQLQVNQGVINVHLRTLPSGGVSVITPSGQVDLLAPGRYHIDAGQPNGTTPPDHSSVTVLEGSAQFDGQPAPTAIQAGEAATIATDSGAVTIAQGSPVPFDDWASSREHSQVATQSAQYVPPGVTGYQDLDSAGTWAPAPAVGPVWYPTAVPVGWAPYRYGHWAFVPPWGWTWIDDAPWGFAPFHYGRWLQVDGRWGWSPVYGPHVGLEIGRPVYAPALVAFIGGGGFGISLSVGGAVAGIGWVPLGPDEPFHPWYHASRGYVRNVNVVNVSNTTINNIAVVNNRMTVDRFANHSAAVVVPATAFTHAAPIQRATVAMSGAELAHVSVAANLRQFRATPEARAAVVRPNAVGVERPGVAATVAPHPVAMSAEPAARAAALPHAPGPAIRQRAAAPPGSQAARPQTRPAAAAAPPGSQAARPQTRPAAAAAAPGAARPPAAGQANVRPQAQPAPGAAHAAPAPANRPPPQQANVRPARPPQPHAAAAAPPRPRPAQAAGAPRPAQHQAPAKAAPGPQGKPNGEKEKKPE
jgi:hypothetical protein